MTENEPQQPMEIETTGTSRGSRGRRMLIIALIIVGGLLVLIYAGVGWYVSGEILDAMTVTPYVVEYDTDVISVNDTEIVIGVSDETTVDDDRDAVMGLRWEGGYGQIGPAASFEAGVETRPFELIAGTPPPVGEDVADFDSFAYPNDPAVLGIDFETVSYETPLGDVEGWLFPGVEDNWIIAVHGRAADRTEYLRLVQAVSDRGYPILVIRYRNDPDSPATGDSLILMGQEEYPDVAAGVDFALDNGASGVVVYGASLGGAMTLSYALEEDRDVVRGLILEAPGADLREIVQLRSGEALPIKGFIGDSLLAAGRLVTTLRTGLDFDQVDYVERADGLSVPILLLHGADDTTVPIEIGQSLAAARPDLVEFHPIDDAAHVRAWNEDPDWYAQTVAEFLGRIGSE